MTESNPKIFDTRPAPIELDGGKTVYWCACGRSENQPFCDGSHRGTGIEPLAFTPEKRDTYFFCLCKQTPKPPLCDGTHKRLLKEKKEK